MTNAEKLTLKKHACHIRMGVIEGTHSAGCGHPAPGTEGRMASWSSGRQSEHRRRAVLSVL